MTGRMEMMEEQRKVETNQSTDTRNEIDCARRDVAKPKIITSVPDVEFTDIKDINKNPWDTM